MTLFSRSFWSTNLDLRFSLALCDKEKRFRQTRRERVMLGIKKLLDMEKLRFLPSSPEEVDLLLFTCDPTLTQKVFICVDRLDLYFENTTPCLLDGFLMFLNIFTLHSKANPAVSFMSLLLLFGLAAGCFSPPCSTQGWLWALARPGPFSLRSKLQGRKDMAPIWPWWERVRNLSDIRKSAEKQDHNANYEIVKSPNAQAYFCCGTLMTEAVGGYSTSQKRWNAEKNEGHTAQTCIPLLCYRCRWSP